MTDRPSSAPTKPARKNPPLLSWLVPVLVVTAVCAALAATYLGGTLNATDSLADFPIAVVNEDAGAILPTGQELAVGEDLAAGLVDGIDDEQFDVHELTLAQAEREMNEGSLYGALVLPESLSADVAAFAQGALTAGEVKAPAVEVLTNPRMGAFSVNIVTTLGRTAFETANTALGRQLEAQLRETQAALGITTPTSAVTALSLHSPLDVEVIAFDPLPDGTGSGLSAFYYALILILAGFSGSLVANAFIDSRLGVVPFELGARYRMEIPSGFSRTRTLVAKWIVMTIIAVIVSALYVAVSSALGMPIGHPWELWAFGALAITGIAVVAQTINALLGNPGLMVNLFIMVVLAIPSSGGTVPLEATPGVFRWLGTFEPMRQIYAGTRSILYLDATWETGLGQGVTAALIATISGLAVGLVGMRVFDARGFIRGPAPLPVSVPSRTASDARTTAPARGIDPDGQSI
jgi:YhgE/Pip-like protein